MLSLSRARSRRLVSILAAAVAATALAACGSTAKAIPNISGGSELDFAIPANIAGLALTNQDGTTVHLADFKGKTVVIQDGMTLCQEQCPIDTATFVEMARQYATKKDAADVVFLTITVDPERDDPAQMAAYRNLYAGGAAALPQWQMLTGSPADIATLWKYFHVSYEKVPSDGDVHNWRTGAALTYDVQHSDEVFFIDPQQTQRYLLDGMPTLGGTIPGPIEGYMSEDGQMNMKMTGWTVADGLNVLKWVKSL